MKRFMPPILLPWLIVAATLLMGVAAIQAPQGLLPGGGAQQAARPWSAVGAAVQADPRLPALDARVRATTARLAVSLELQRGAVAAFGAVEAAPRPLGRVLMVGDSMAWPVGMAFKPLMEEAGLAFEYDFLVNDALHAWRRTRLERL